MTASPLHSGPLPRLMVAPNGARRGKGDHPALPITDAEMIATARACHTAGADGIHLHIAARRYAQFDQ